MHESSSLEHSLAVEVRDCNGCIKEARYVSKVLNGREVEFIPNRLYLSLLNRGVIRSNTFKIPFVLGTRHTLEN